MGNSSRKIIKNTVMLYGLSISKMIFPLITLPYLTRVLSVPTYGVVTYVKAVMQYMQLVVDFGFMLSGTRDIALAGENKETINHEVGNIFVARIILSCAAFAVLLLSSVFIPILKENLLFTLLSFIVVLLTVFLMDFYFRGIEKMEIITIRFVIMKGIATVLTFFIVKGDSDVLWIPILDIIGSIVAVTMVWGQLYKEKVRIRPEGFKPALKKLKDSAVFFFSDMATTAFNALNTLLIGAFIDATNVAYWGLCMQLIGAVQSLYTPITSGIYPQMMRSKNRGLIKRTLTLFMPIVLVGCVITFFAAKFALYIVGGEKYIEAAYILRLLVPVLLFSFPSMLYGWPTLGAIGKQKETTATTIIAAGFQILMLLLLVLTNKFNLISICIIRCITEALLFVLRFGCYWKYKDDFNYNTSF